MWGSDGVNRYLGLSYGGGGLPSTVTVFGDPGAGSILSVPNPQRSRSSSRHYWDLPGHFICDGEGRKRDDR